MFMGCAFVNYDKCVTDKYIITQSNVSKESNIIKIQLM